MGASLLGVCGSPQVAHPGRIIYNNKVSRVSETENAHAVKLYCRTGEKYTKKLIDNKII